MSSFIIRGKIYTNDILTEKFGEDVNEMYKTTNGLILQTTRCYFDGEETGETLIGLKLGNMDDGCVTMIPKDSTDKDCEIMNKFLELGLSFNPTTEEMNTFVGYISNDNY